MAESVPLVKVKMLRTRYIPGRGRVEKDEVVELPPKVAQRWVSRRIAVSVSGEAPIKSSPVKTFSELKAEVKEALAKKTVKELKEDLEEKGVDVPSKAKKDDLIEALAEVEAGAEVEFED